MHCVPPMVDLILNCSNDVMSFSIHCESEYQCQISLGICQRGDKEFQGILTRFDWVLKWQHLLHFHWCGSLLYCTLSNNPNSLKKL